MIPKNELEALHEVSDVSEGYFPIYSEAIHQYCLSKPCAYESRPFGADTICYRVAGKIFAQSFMLNGRHVVTLKAEPDASYFYRSAYPGVIVRGWHCPPVQQPYWNTVAPEDIPEALLYQLIDGAYDAVVAKLSRKERSRLPVLGTYRFEKTDGAHPAFVTLCEELEADLDVLIAGAFDRSQYVPYNLRDNIHDVLLAWQGTEAVACGAYRLYDEETVELKRVFTKQSQRGIGLGREIVRRLEADARRAGFRYVVLETGEPLQAAMKLYRSMGYRVIPNYGPYVDMPDSICMGKKL